MRSFLMFVVGAVVGAAATFFLAGGILTGIGAGAGIATGLQAGACLTAGAAKEKGYITANQVGELLAEAGAQIAGETPTQGTSFAGSDEDCAKIVADLKAAAR